MLTVTTYAELEAAVLRDETFLRLEGGAKQFYEQKVGDTVGALAVGALPGFLVGGFLGAAAGAAIGAAITNRHNPVAPNTQNVASFLMRYYRKSSSGVNYIELTHR